jgi:hypothetical protein
MREKCTFARQYRQSLNSFQSPAGECGWNFFEGSIHMLSERELIPNSAEAGDSESTWLRQLSFVLNSRSGQETSLCQELQSDGLRYIQAGGGSVFGLSSAASAESGRWSVVSENEQIYLFHAPVSETPDGSRHSANQTPDGSRHSANEISDGFRHSASNGFHGWSKSEELTRSFEQFGQCLSTKFAGMEELLHKHICVLSRVLNATCDIALCIQGSELRNVAWLLHNIKELPPVSVVKDWETQLRSVSSKLHTQETLVTPDGLLLPMSRWLDEWSAHHQLSPSAVTLELQDQLKQIEWPRSKTGMSTVLDNALNKLLNDKPNVPARRIPLKSQSKFHKPSIVAAIGVGFVILIGTLYLFRSDSTTDKNDLPTSAANPIESKLSAIETHTTSMETETENTDLSSSLTVMEIDSSVLSSAMPTSDDLTIMDPMQTDPLSPILDLSIADTLDSMLAKLTPERPQGLSLESMSSASVVSHALEPAVFDFSDGDDSKEKETIEKVSDDASTPSTDDATSVVDGVVNGVVDGFAVAEQSVAIDTAFKRISIPLRKLVIPKESRVEVQLKLAKEFVVEPAGTIVLEGEQAATWRIALEDQEPELALELNSKPSNKWQLKSTLVLKMNRNAPPIAIAPSDAQRVGNRLIEYIHWLDQSIATLQNARASMRRRIRFDFVGEIKKMELQRREAEKAIEQWKVVERLSYLFYEENAVQLKLFAKLKLAN